MFEMQRILVATDFSRQAIKAESRAALLCRTVQQDTLDLLAVRAASLSEMLADAFQSTRPEQEAALVQKALQDLKRSADRLKSLYGIDCNYAVRFGDLTSELMAAAESKSADMVVIAEPRKNAFEKLLNTSTDRLIRLSKRPVLLVRNETTHHYRSVLIPVDFSPESRHAARLALEIAPQARIVFLHAYRVWAEGQMREAGVNEGIINGYRMKYREEARLDLNQFIEELGPASQLVSRAIEHGWAAPVIAAYARNMAPDLIVLGKHSGSRAEEFLMGSVTRRAIDETTADILITPGDDPGNDHWYERPAA